MERRKNHIRDWKDTWIDHFFDLPLWGRALLIGILASILAFALDEVAHVFGYPWYLERIVQNALEGIVIGVVVYRLSRLREKRVERRMKEIGFLNHHIRNAMQAIKVAAAGITDAQERMAVIDMSVSRVVETLSRISRENDELELESHLQHAA